ncbi:hypothetical protein [Actinoplanes palleronii]|uniref:Uncharacterized protein n=1 Tax=Actinoplanes palleronii TaxID=113570 RepID=A0ABQ4BG96_9ACTN|nr:hypothetical protein [Actinoplanes palleronii]GIE69627.1 hypothetical protein Apa02nite_057350 [Actinoplanes palleronii]
MRPFLLSLVIAGSVVPLAACGGGSSSTGAPTAATTSSAAEVPTLSADAQVKLVAWFEDSRHREGLQAIDHAFGEVKRSMAIDPAAAADFSNIRSACDFLDHDLTIITKFDPIPDPQAQALWSSALTDLQQGAKDCRTGATAGDAAQVAAAKTTLTRGDTAYAAVVARLGVALGAGTPSPSS